VGGMFDFALLAKRGADEADRITAVALNFEVKRERFAFNGHSKIAADRVLKRFSRKIRKEDAFIR